MEDIRIEDAVTGKMGIENYSGLEKRVVHELHGPGKIVNLTFIGPRSVAYVKFDSLEEEVLVPEDELAPEIKKPTTLDYKEKDAEKIRIETHKKEIEKTAEMNNETLIEAFEFTVRMGAGPIDPVIVFMKREILKRMNNL